VGQAAGLGPWSNNAYPQGCPECGQELVCLAEEWIGYDSSRGWSLDVTCDNVLDDVDDPVPDPKPHPQTGGRWVFTHVLSGQLCR
jgi:hypothetical protein